MRAGQFVSRVFAVLLRKSNPQSHHLQTAPVLSVSCFHGVPTMPFPDNLGTIACPCVISGSKPVLFVSHGGGDWQMYCHWKNHNFEDHEVLKTLSVVHVAHLVARDATINEVADLPADMGAERTHVGAMWQRYEDEDD